MPDDRPHVCVVTGATSGVGLETARALAAGGNHVVGVARNPARAQRAAESIRATATGPVSFVLADLAELAQVRDLAARLLDAYPRIDVLINNAGMYRLRRHATVDGFESMFAVNHLAPFLLTSLLLERLRASAPARVIATASVAHLGARLDLSVPADRMRAGWRGYCNSKLANVMFTYALARRLDGTTVTANCFHPGFVVSNFGSGNGIPVKPFMLVARPFGISPRKAAQAPAWLATAPELAGTSGVYFNRRTPARSSPMSLNEDLQEQLWTLSAEWTGAATR